MGSGGDQREDDGQNLTPGDGEGSKSLRGERHNCFCLLWRSFFVFRQKEARGGKDGKRGSRRVKEEACFLLGKVPSATERDPEGNGQTWGGTSAHIESLKTNTTEDEKD